MCQDSIKKEEDIFLECEMYSEKIWQLLQNTRKTTHQGNSAKTHQNINKEDITYYQNLGTATTTINFKNILYNTLPKNTYKKHAKLIEAIIYQGTKFTAPGIMNIK